MIRCSELCRVACLILLMILGVSSFLRVPITTGYQSVTAALRRYSPSTLHASPSASAVTLPSAAANANKRAVIVGATGYIGKYVTKEAVMRGYDTIAIVRPGANVDSPFFKGVTIVYSDVTNFEELKNCEVFAEKSTAIISCLASRSGVKEDSFNIDYQATLNVLNAAIGGKGVDQFILLSAFCVRKPLLQFQKAKLLFEKSLIEKQSKGELQKYSIVRPTAFFKSVSGQFELLEKVGIACLCL